MSGIFILAILAIALCGPIATIWALNTLFPMLNIELTFATYFAALWVSIIFGAVRAARK